VCVHTHTDRNTHARAHTHTHTHTKPILLLLFCYSYRTTLPYSTSPHRASRLSLLDSPQNVSPHGAAPARPSNGLAVRAMSTAICAGYGNNMPEVGIRAQGVLHGMNHSLSLLDAVWEDVLSTSDTQDISESKRGDTRSPRARISCWTCAMWCARARQRFATPRSFRQTCLQSR
jgi:hypothetical protein